MEISRFHVYVLFIIFLSRIKNLRAHEEVFQNTSDANCHQNCIQLLDSDNKTCSNELPAFLLYCNNYYLMNISFVNNESTRILSDVNFMKAFDFSYKEESILWFNDDDFLYKKKIDKNDTKIEKIVINNGESMDVIAYDWIYDHLYWVDNSKGKIFVSNVDGSHPFLLLDQEKLNVTSIAIDPNEGWIFWSDEENDGRIESSHLDGTTHRITASDDVTNIASLTLDLVKKRVYWAERKSFTISYCDYNGTNRNILITLNKETEPLSIIAFEDWIYWAGPSIKIYRVDISKTVMQSSPMLIFQDSKNFSFDVNLIKIYHPYQQPNGKNVCANNPCSHLCFPNHFPGSEISYTCKCSIGYKEHIDGKTCFKEEKMGEVTVFIIGTAVALVIMVLLYIYRNLLFKIKYSEVINSGWINADDEDFDLVGDKHEEYIQLH